MKPVEFDAMVGTRNNRGIGHENGSVESSHRHLKPPRPVPERLRTGSRRLISWQRSYLRQDKPFAVGLVYIAKKFPQFTRELVSSYQSYHTFESILKLKIDHADIMIRAHPPSAELGKIMGISAATPVIAMERVSYLADATPIEYIPYRARADSYEFSFKVRQQVDFMESLVPRAAPVAR